MTNLRLKALRIATVTGGDIILGEKTAEFRMVSTDSRDINSGDLFVAIKGESFDGHEYADTAIEMGAKGVLIASSKTRDALVKKYSNKSIQEQPILIFVEDTLAAFGQIAHDYRERFDCSLVAVTGSVGKTSTKEMIAGLLSQSMEVHKTNKNFNNEIGVPKTLLGLTKNHQVAVVEMGMNHPNEIKRLSDMAHPNVAVITNIGDAHIGILGSKQNILKAKLEILSGLDAAGVLVINSDDDLLAGVAGIIDVKTITYGMDEGADVRADSIVRNSDDSLSFDIEYKGDRFPAALQQPGIHNILNALAAVAVGLVLNLPFERLAEGVSNLEANTDRMQFIEVGGCRLIDDTYNASPTAMKAALRTLGELNHDGRKIAVMGTMLELGEFAEELHYAVGMEAAQYGIDVLVPVGEFAENVKEGAIDGGCSPEAVILCEDNEEAVTRVRALLEPGDCVLFKASHGARLNAVVSEITAKLNDKDFVNE